jgi:hypothetical protein
MRYSASINSRNPGCFIILLNLSDSMRKPDLQFGKRGQSRAEACCDAINDFLEEMLLSCSKGDYDVDYYNVGVFGYRFNADEGPLFANLLPTPADGSILHTVTALRAAADVKEEILRTPDATGHVIQSPIKRQIWLSASSKSVAEYIFPVEMLLQSLRQWTSLHHDSYPPIVIHLTDVERISYSLVRALKALKEVHTNDGNAILFNCALTGEAGGTLMFPEADAPLSDGRVIGALWDESGLLPQGMAKWFRDEDKPSLPVRAFCMATSGDGAAQFLHSILRLLPPPGTTPARIKEFEVERNRAMELAYRRLGEARAESQEKRARRAHVYSIIALIISMISLLVSIAKMFIEK